jgi:hypothetical protein
MATFKQGNVKLNDNQKIVLGTDEDSNFYFDGTNLCISSTVSGVTPTQDYHLVTKQYADTLSGTSSSGITSVVSDTAPKLGGELDMNTFNIRLTTSGGSADDTACGFTTTMTVDTNSVGIGCALRMGGDGNFDHADCTATGTMPCTTIALETGTGSKKVLMMGFMRHDAWAWTPGLPIFTSVSGLLSQSGPTASGTQVQIVGYATHADRMYFNPQLIIGEVIA